MNNNMNIKFNADDIRRTSFRIIENLSDACKDTGQLKA